MKIEIKQAPFQGKILCAYSCGMLHLISGGEARCQINSAYINGDISPGPSCPGPGIHEFMSETEATALRQLVTAVEEHERQVYSKWELPPFTWFAVRNLVTRLRAMIKPDTLKEEKQYGDTYGNLLE